MNATLQPTVMTVAEFLELPGERHELVDGVVHDMPPSSPRHGVIAAHAARLLGNHLQGHPRCRVVIEPGVQPRMNAAHNVRIPDLAVTCAPIGADDRLLAQPVVLVEILSPSNRHHTEANVWAYTTVPSVQDILVLHSGEARANVLRRQGNGSWPADASVLGPDDEVELASFGFRHPLAAFYL